MKPFVILMWIFGVSGSASISLIPLVVLRDRKLNAKGVTSPGTITKMVENDEGYFTHVEFLVGGTRHEIIAGSSGEYRVGQAVRVRYLPESPSAAIIDEPARIWFGTRTIVAVSIAFSAMTFVCYALRHIGG